MRQRLTPEKRRAGILAHARTLFLARGYGATEMEDIRCACGISRGGLYHHFPGKPAILAALVRQETEDLCATVQEAAGNPLAALIEAGSTHLGRGPGVLEALVTQDERLLYLTYLEQAQTDVIAPALETALETSLREGVKPSHAVALFLTVNAAINRRTIAGNWTSSEAADFAATALEGMAGLMADPDDLSSLAQLLRTRGDNT